MNPYVGAPVVVNVDASHNNGHSLAAATITGLNEDGTVNVRVWYDVPPHFLHRHAREHLDHIQFHDTSDPAVAGKHGLHGAFWPAAPQQQDLTIISEQLEKIMAAQDDINAAAAAITNASGIIGTVATDLGNVKTEILAALAAFQAANPAADTSALNTAVEGLNGPLSALQAADSALDAAASSAASATAPAAPAPAEPAPAAPAEGTAGSTVAAGDGGSAA